MQKIEYASALTDACPCTTCDDLACTSLPYIRRHPSGLIITRQKMSAYTSSTAHLGALTYPSPNLKDFTLDDNILERNLPLDNGRHSLEPKSDLGKLQALPPELMHGILMQLDLRSLTNFRRVNQLAMLVIDSIPQYQSIIKHSLDSLRSILAIEVGSHISCRRLFETLTKATCENCHDFAGYIYLPACSRVCFLCLSEDIKYLPLQAMEVKCRLGLPYNAIAGLPRLKSIPGRYSPNEKLRRSRLTLYDYASALRAAEAHHGSIAAMQHSVDIASSNRLEAYQKKVLDKSRKEVGSSVRRPPYIASRGALVLDPRRFMAVVRAPCLDVSSGTKEWGFHCSGCRRDYRSRPFHWRRKYSPSTFLDHVRECGQRSQGSHDV